MEHFRPEELAMHHQDINMQACIDDCLRCHQACFGMASHHCLEVGGKHLEAEHMRLMLACAEICRAAAAVMLTGVEQHKMVCAACAEICEACARSCEAIGDMDSCVEACRRCAESCRRMAA
jgi:hypothetical protein